MLFTDDGWMLMGDIVEIGEDGVLTVVGRVADIIIRGGKNVSAPMVESEVATHPGVALVAAVPAPDPVLGERVALFVVPRPGWEQITLDEIVEHVAGRGMSPRRAPRAPHAGGQPAHVVGWQGGQVRAPGTGPK